MQQVPDLLMGLDISLSLISDRGLLSPFWWASAAARLCAATNFDTLFLRWWWFSDSAAFTSEAVVDEEDRASERWCLEEGVTELPGVVIDTSCSIGTSSVTGCTKYEYIILDKLQCHVFGVNTSDQIRSPAIPKKQLYKCWCLVSSCN